MVKINEDREIFVVCDMNNITDEHTLQVISKARLLADDSNKKLSLLFVGTASNSDFKEISKYGVDKIIYCKCELKIGVWGFSDIVADVMKSYNPDVVLFLATRFGKDAAAIISTRFGAGLTADCIDIRYDNESGKFNFLRAAMSDSVIAKITCINCDFQMSTVKKDVFKKNEVLGDRAAEIIDYRFDLNSVYQDDIPEILEVNQIVEESETIDINKFSTVFCVGRGASSPETMKLIYALAEKCNACVVGTRAVIEENILEKAVQVGQSGKSISPKVYVGFGVSGASQHLVGIKNAGIIIAVNKDPNAPIFKYADYAIIEDVNDILNKMYELLRI